VGRKNNSAKAEQGSTPQPTAIGKARGSDKRVSTTRGVKKGTQGHNLLGKDKKTVGRPLAYTEELGEAIADQIAEGKSLREALTHVDNAPSERTVRRWISTENHAFCRKYARAREIGLEVWADNMRALAKTATPENHQAVKLQIETDKWLLSKLASKTFGDRLDTRVEAEVKVTQAMPSDGELARILAAAIAEAEAPILLEAHSVTDTGAGP
jgi:hypothetical protein